MCYIKSVSTYFVTLLFLINRIFHVNKITNAVDLTRHFSAFVFVARFVVFGPLCFKVMVHGFGSPQGRTAAITNILVALQRRISPPYGHVEPGNADLDQHN